MAKKLTGLSEPIEPSKQKPGYRTIERLGERADNYLRDVAHAQTELVFTAAEMNDALNRRPSTPIKNGRCVGCLEAEKHIVELCKERDARGVRVEELETKLNVFNNLLERCYEFKWHRPDCNYYLDDESDYENLLDAGMCTCKSGYEEDQAKLKFLKAELESWKETCEILADDDMREALRESIAEKGKGKTHTTDEIRKRIGLARHNGEKK